MSVCRAKYCLYRQARRGNDLAPRLTLHRCCAGQMSRQGTAVPCRHLSSWPEQPQLSPPSLLSAPVPSREDEQGVRDLSATAAVSGNHGAGLAPGIRSLGPRFFECPTAQTSAPKERGRATCSARCRPRVSQISAAHITAVSTRQGARGRRVASISGDGCGNRQCPSCEVDTETRQGVPRWWTRWQNPASSVWPPLGFGSSPCLSCEFQASRPDPLQ